MELHEHMNPYNTRPTPHAVPLPQPPLLDEPSESVDLLQMVADTPTQRTMVYDRNSCPRHSTKQNYKSKSSDSDSGLRAHFVVLPGEEPNRDKSNGEAEAALTAGHICHSCREGTVCGGHGAGASDIYTYHTNRQHVNPYTSRTMPSPSVNRTASSTEEGSAYFNYLRFANSSAGTSPCTVSSVYEPVDREIEPHHTSLKTALSCCLRRKKPPKKNNKLKNRKCINRQEHEDAFLPKPEVDVSASAHRCAGAGNKDWRRIKRLLLLAAVLLGILLAIGGMIVGFLLMSPRQDETCRVGFIFCGDIGCLPHSRACAGTPSACPHSYAVKNCNNTAPETPIERHDGKMPPGQTFLPHTEPPIKDLSGWVHYSGGSPNGSRYLVVNSPMTYYAGQDECRKKGGYLAHVNTIREQVYLEDFLQQELLNIDVASDTAGFWLGARRSRGSHSGTCMYDQWKWLDANGIKHDVISGFTAFAPGKPDNYFSPEECLYISFQSQEPHSYLKWDDAPCDIQSVGAIKVICEVPSR